MYVFVRLCLLAKYKCLVCFSFYFILAFYGLVKGKGMGKIS